MTMAITPDKLSVMRSKLSAWAAASHLGGKEIESVTGLLCFLADGCEASRPFVGCFYVLRQRARDVARASKSPLEDVRLRIVVGSECAHALQTVSTIFAQWDGFCPIVGGFSPTAFAQGIGFTDASTKDGCGGIAYAPCPRSMGPVSDVMGFCEAYPASIRAEAMVVEAESTAFLEAFAILRWLELFGERFARQRVLLVGDSKSALCGVGRAFSKVARLQRVIVLIRVRLAALHITLRLACVHTSRNACANSLSHDRVEEASALCLRDFGRRLRLLESAATLRCSPTAASASSASS